VTRLERPEPVPPGPGQESAWDYPRPPRLEEVRVQCEVVFGGHTIAVTLTPIRVLETSHPPAYYFPPGSVLEGALRPAEGSTWCEFKGETRYFDVVRPDAEAPRAAWSYPHPLAGYEALAGYVAFYPRAMEACLVGGELVRPQPGGFYGGWVTSTVVGPFKGEPGTEGW